MSIKANFYALYGQINRTQSQQISREDSVKQSNPSKDLLTKSSMLERRNLLQENDLRSSMPSWTWILDASSKIERTTQAIKSNTSLSRWYDSAMTLTCCEKWSRNFKATFDEIRGSNLSRVEKSGRWILHHGMETVVSTSSWFFAENLKIWSVNRFRRKFRSYEMQD